jgi:hypothetical protein
VEHHQVALVIFFSNGTHQIVIVEEQASNLGHILSKAYDGLP